MSLRKIFILLMIVIPLVGCYQLKPEPTSVDTYIEQNISDFESALENLNYEKLQELLADDLIIDWESVNKDDLDKLIEFIGDYDSIDTAILTELERSISDNTIVIDAELYLELIKNQEQYSDTRLINIIIENLGDKWTGDKWLITSLITYTNEEYIYQDPAAEPNELLDRFADALLNKAFNELPDLLAYTVVTTNGTAVNYYRNNQQFIALLANDMQELDLVDIAFENRDFTLDPNGILVTTDLIVTYSTAGNTITDSQTIDITILEIPAGIVINRLFYASKFFGFI